MEIAADAQHIPRRLRYFRLRRIAEVLAMGIHRHWVAAHLFQLAAFGGLVHLVPHILEISAQVELAPVELPSVARVHEPGIVAGHVHVLVGEALKRDVLRAAFDDEQIAVVAHGHANLWF